MEIINTTDDYFFLENGGEAAEIIRNLDWSSNSLGRPEIWPENLKNTLATLLPSKFPMFLWWGNDLIQFYNDAYRPSFGEQGKHPKAMGQKAKDCWPEIWDFLAPHITNILATGESVWYENMLLPIHRNGKLEDVYWTFSYSPVRGDDRQIEGVLVVCNETTNTVNHNKQLQNSKDELLFAIEAAELGTFDLNPITNRFSANNRLKSWFGLQPDDEIALHVATDVIAEADRDNVIKAIEDALKFELGGKYEIEYTIIHPVTKEEKIVRAKGRAWFNENKEAYRFNGILQDITEHKKANDEIVKSRQLTDLTMQTMGMGVFNVDFATNNIEYSAEFAALISGSKIKDLSRMDFVKYIHPDDLGLRLEAIEQGLTTGKFYYTPRVIWDDGSIHHIAISGARIVDSKGNPKTFSGTGIDITERERSRAALQQAEHRLEQTKREANAMFRNVTDSSPTGLWLADKQGMLTYLNNTLVEWTGIPYSELLGIGWTNAIIEEDRQMAAEVFEEAVNSLSHYDVLFRIKKATGKIVWCRAAGDPFFDESGKYAGYAGFCMDMDEIIASRKALTESEERFSLMIKQAPVGICLFTGLDMKIEIANDIMIGYWGKDKSVMGKPLEVAIPELVGQPFLSLLQEVYLTGVPYEAVSTPARLEVDGKLSTFYFDFTYKPIRDIHGNIYGIMDIAVDVTERVLASQKLDDTRIALAGAIELAELATWQLDIKNKTFSYSKRFMDWLGFTEDTKAMDEAYNPLPNDYRKLVSDAIQAAILPGSSGIYDNEHPIINRVTGQVRIIHATARVFYNSDGMPAYLSGTAQDVTKERKLQEELTFKIRKSTAELRHANTELEINNKELQQFAYIASHDLQEPVRKISVFIQMLENYITSDPEKAKIYIEKINNSAKRMTTLIKDVLGFSELANSTKVFENVDLEEVIENILSDFDLTIEQKEATIIYQNLPKLKAIPLQMGQLFGNLISNALKYSRQDVKPVIKVISSKLNDNDKKLFSIDNSLDYYKIEIIDNGIGFNQKYAEQIFNIFQRLHGKNEFAGTGIGLAMCRKIVQNHNGDIKAFSEEGKGTTFVVVIPEE
ncbi:MULTISPECIES: PAS domain S-box protein [unclassified Arcicella]|uniref:PAS domain S-box protein n=1 Tax=unclassified Arcicella TaxID=2644986 RepID=UPI00285619A2|nr:MULTISPECIES: PAS domain S-box protein [unclassified Arcicella]MDR6561781.1 PAS domain S-box-containing protein [Arcicella sp. BE51]MDR6812561.1 PAS domain S-box-containing protein [Arcicella sp. BE140]MDR6823667.1 PAS domain S-box-containing protein [Arcicella sp. BE139]